MKTTLIAIVTMCIFLTFTGCPDGLSSKKYFNYTIQESTIRGGDVITVLTDENVFTKGSKPYMIVEVFQYTKDATTDRVTNEKINLYAHKKISEKSVQFLIPKSFFKFNKWDERLDESRSGNILNVEDYNTYGRPAIGFLTNLNEIDIINYEETLTAEKDAIYQGETLEIKSSKPFFQIRDKENAQEFAEFFEPISGFEFRLDPSIMDFFLMCEIVDFDAQSLTVKVKDDAFNDRTSDSVVINDIRHVNLLSISQGANLAPLTTPEYPINTDPANNVAVYHLTKPFTIYRKIAD